MSGPTGSHRRQFRNFVIDPSSQYKMASSYIFLGLGFMVIVGLVSYLLTTNLVYFVREVGNLSTEAQSTVSAIVRLMAFTYGAVFFILILVVSAAAVFISHRVFGPTIALRRHLAKLKEGDYSAHTRLRKNDYLGPIAQDLNDLSEKLRNSRNKVG